MTQEVLKLALEALEANYLLVNGTETHGGLEQCLDGYYSGCFDTDPINKQTEEAITAIKEALAHCPDCGQLLGDAGHIHTCSPQRTWVGLTDEEAMQICVDCGCLSEDWLTLLDAIEAKLKQKNGFAEEKNT